MSTVDKAKLRELAEKATPGAWGKDGVYVCTTITAGETIYVQTWNAVAESHEESNAQFIAAANPAIILALLDESDSLQSERDALVEALEDIGSSCHGVNTELERYMRNVARRTLAARTRPEHPTT